MRHGFAARGGWTAAAALLGGMVVAAEVPAAAKRFSIVYSIHNHGYVEPCG